MIMSEAIVFLIQKPWLLAIICSVTGYLIGSVSFARIVYFIVTKNRKIESFSEPVPHSDETFESDLVSATLVTKKIGARYGCITSIADMLKVAVPDPSGQAFFHFRTLLFAYCAFWSYWP